MPHGERQFLAGEDRERRGDGGRHQRGERRRAEHAPVGGYPPSCQGASRIDHSHRIPYLGERVQRRASNFPVDWDRHGRSNVMAVIVITGGAGRIGTMLRPRLARPDRTLRLVDIAEIGDVAPAEEAVVASVTDLAALTSAFEGADAV